MTLTLISRHPAGQVRRMRQVRRLMPDPGYRMTTHALEALRRGGLAWHADPRTPRNLVKHLCNEIAFLDDLLGY